MPSISGDPILSLPHSPCLFFSLQLSHFFFMLAVTEYITLNKKRRKKYNSVNNLFAKMLKKFYYLLLSSALASLSACICLKMVNFEEYISFYLINRFSARKYFSLCYSWIALQIVHCESHLFKQYPCTL